MFSDVSGGNPRSAMPFRCGLAMQGESITLAGRIEVKRPAIVEYDVVVTPALPDAWAGTVSTRGPAPDRYQCTPFMMFAIAICSMFAFSAAAGSFSPLDAAESGKTL